jgi:hypothetical protein
MIVTVVTDAAWVGVDAKASMVWGLSPREGSVECWGTGFKTITRWDNDPVSTIKDIVLVSIFREKCIVQIVRAQFNGVLGCGIIFTSYRAQHCIQYSVLT